MTRVWTSLIVCSLLVFGQSSHLLGADHYCPIFPLYPVDEVNWVYYCDVNDDMCVTTDTNCFVGSFATWPYEDCGDCEPAIVQYMYGGAPGADAKKLLARSNGNQVFQGHPMASDELTHNTGRFRFPLTKGNDEFPVPDAEQVLVGIPTLVKARFTNASAYRFFRVFQRYQLRGKGAGSVHLIALEVNDPGVAVTAIVLPREKDGNPRDFAVTSVYAKEDGTVGAGPRQTKLWIGMHNSKQYLLVVRDPKAG